MLRKAEVRIIVALTPNCRRPARAVVGFEAAVDDGARDRLAAGAAERALLAEQETETPAGG